MPRVTLPPTPASSTDIKGKDGTGNVPTLHLAFELPPPALTGNDARLVSPTETKPPTPRTRRRSSAATAARIAMSSSKERENEFALPPPPTRSRKIIQMKPKAQEVEGDGDGDEDGDGDGDEAKASSKKASAGSATATPATGAATASGGRKKQPSATSAAGRKIARKTAHSLIERRRRSKMNEEFAVLKSMIPACTGEMHKLAILQVCLPNTLSP
jgi:hypothetical protein